MKYLNLPIARLPLSESFKQTCSNNNIIGLHDLLDYDVDNLGRLPGVTLAMLDELQQFLDTHQFLITAPGHDGVEKK